MSARARRQVAERSCKRPGLSPGSKARAEAGTRVGNRIIGADSFIIVGWDNILLARPGEALHLHLFPAILPFALIAFWYYAPNSIATATTAIAIAISFWCC